MRNLTLFIPGLLGPDTHYSEDFAPGLNSLERLLSRSDHSPVSPSWYRSLCELSGMTLDPDRDVPVGAITRLHDDNQHPEGNWMRADPVHLRPDRDGLNLMDSFILRLNQHDALAIATEVNKVLAAYGWVMEVPYEDRWYIKMDETTDLTTTELPAVVGKDIRHYLPKGHDAKKINNILNEIQMQLYSCDLNQLRESNGELPINSVWFWGAGKIPADIKLAWSVVFSDETFVRGLARRAGKPCHAVPAEFDSVLAACKDDDDVMIVLQHCQAPTQYQNLMLWHEALKLLEQNWFQQLPALLQKGNVCKLSIIGDGHRFTTSWMGMKRFWRKPVPIGNYRKL